MHTVTVQNDLEGTSETICVPNRRIYSSEVFDMINFGLLYVTPLLVMTVSCHSTHSGTELSCTIDIRLQHHPPPQLLYSRIAITLWQSSRQLDYCIPMQNVPASVMQQTTTNITNGNTNNSSSNNNRAGGRNGHGRGRGTTAVEPTEEEDVDAEVVELARNGTNLLHNTNNNNNNNCDVQQGVVGGGGGGGGGPDNSNMFVQHKMVPIPQSSYNILRARRGVIRMLIVVVLTFALCNLPIHARKIWQYWWVHGGGMKRD